MGKTFFHFSIISFMLLQLQSNLDKSASDNRELKKISGEIFRCTMGRNKLIKKMKPYKKVLWKPFY
jgi:hypothetical protein